MGRKVTRKRDSAGAGRSGVGRAGGRHLPQARHPPAEFSCLEEEVCWFGLNELRKTDIGHKSGL